VTNTIHIVCLDAPSPPDYGGAIDMHYKIKALHSIGKNIVLHYFDYKTNRNVQGLEACCSETNAYKRKNFFVSPSLSRPFIVQSRINDRLIQRLNEDSHPVLLEGLHCTGIIPFLKQKGRVLVRMHNDEASYYSQLSNTERSFAKKNFFRWESHLLHRYQNRLNRETSLVCLSGADKHLLERKYGFRAVHFIPCFLPWQEANCQEGKGDYCLYHGNLSVAENEKAVFWLMENVFSKLTIPFVVAGKGASRRLFQMAGRNKQMRLISNPPADEMDALVRDAHIHVLPAMNNAGVKLKILNALLNGRHCITNENGIHGAGIADGVVVQNDAAAWLASIQELWAKEFTAVEREERKKLLSLYDNQANAQKLNALLRHCQ
jgi:hypothetical protein